MVGSRSAGDVDALGGVAVREGVIAAAVDHSEQRDDSEIAESEHLRQW
jgi:hypothetical protein